MRSGWTCAKYRLRKLSKKERDARKFARGVPDASLPRELLKASPFRWLTLSESISLVARGARRVRVTREGEPLCVQGHVAATAFVVLKGKLEALFFGSRVRELRRGDVIGADCLFTGAARKETVFAVSEEAWVLEIQRKAVAVLARRRPTALDEIAAVVAFLYPYDADSATSTATVVVNDVDETLNKLLL